MIKVDKNKQIPKNPMKKYPWDLLKVGDSFFHECSIQQLTSAATRWRKYQQVNQKHTARTVTENGKKGARIWRTK